MLAQRRQVGLVNAAARENIVLVQNTAENANNCLDVLCRVFVPVLTVVGDQKVALLHELLHWQVLPSKPQHVRC